MNKIEKELEDLQKVSSSGELLLLKKLIEYKSALNTKLKKETEEFNELSFEYMSKKNELLLNTDWSSVINGRVTETLKNAYIETELRELFASKKVAEENLHNVKREIDLVNGRISAEKHVIRLMLLLCLILI